MAALNSVFLRRLALCSPPHFSVPLPSPHVLRIADVSDLPRIPNNKPLFYSERALKACSLPPKVFQARYLHQGAERSL